MLPALLDAFGEPVLLPSGTVTAIFDPVGSGAGSPWSEIGLDVRIGEQTAPSLVLSSTDAAVLARDDEVTARGKRYLVTRVSVSPRSASETWVEIMEA